MTLDQGRTLSTRSILPACLVISSLSLAIASRGLLKDYSYWLDELYSVSFSSGGWGYLYERLLGDVHPPLYQIALKLWMSVFGSTESATRMLSFAFSVITAAAFTIDAVAGRRWRRVLALLLIGASPFFSFYSQETRSYSLVLALSSLVTLAVLRLRSWAQPIPGASGRTLTTIYYCGSLLLSLTHYFGWIYVFLLSVIGFVENRLTRARSRSVLLVTAVSVWPAWHFFFGDLVDKTGGEFWIKSGIPFAGTINTYLSGCLPFLAFSEPPGPFVLSWLILAVFIAIAAGSWRGVRSFFVHPGRDLEAVVDESRFLLLLIASFLLLLSIVDLHTPMSTPRNYIVLLPPTMLLLSDFLSVLAVRKRAGARSLSAVFFLSVLLVGLLWRQSWTALNGKQQPLQNWKQLAAYVAATDVCSDTCLVMGSHGLHDYYFEGHGKFMSLAGRGDLNRQSEYANRLPEARILGFHRASDVLPDLLKDSPTRVCLQPPQAWMNNAFLVLPQAGLTGKEESFGMTPCVVEMPV
jgi:hypothetical protein